VMANTVGAIFVVRQSAAITKAGARPANRRAVAVFTICFIHALSHHALGRGAVLDVLAGTSRWINARLPRMRAAVMR
jgi:hypothetical protein